MTGYNFGLWNCAYARMTILKLETVEGRMSVEAAIKDLLCAVPHANEIYYTDFPHLIFTTCIFGHQFQVTLGYYFASMSYNLFI